MHEFDEMEIGATDGATVGPFHPWCETFIVKIVSTGPKMGNQLIRGLFGELGGELWGDFEGIGIDRVRGAADIDLILGRLGRVGGES